MKKAKIVGLKTGAKVVITLIMISAGIIIYHYLGILGRYAVENAPASIFILLGWFFLIVGETMLLYMMWEK